MAIELVFATNNAHKLAELRALVAHSDIRILSLSDINCHDDIEETGTTLRENALIKARFIKEKYGYDCFADDTGLEVDALDGAPGVYSARYSGEPTDSERNIDKLLGELAVLPAPVERTAHFSTVIALILRGEEHLFTGSVYGQILTSRQGEGGFGYDSVFQPNGSVLSFAQMSAEDKNAISHRGIATRKLVDFLTSPQ